MFSPVHRVSSIRYELSVMLRLQRSHTLVRARTHTHTISHDSCFLASHIINASKELANGHHAVNSFIKQRTCLVLLTREELLPD